VQQRGARGDGKQGSREDARPGHVHQHDKGIEQIAADEEEHLDPEHHGDPGRNGPRIGISGKGGLFHWCRHGVNPAVRPRGRGPNGPLCSYSSSSAWRISLAYRFLR